MSRRFVVGTAAGATLILSLTGCAGASGGDSAGGGIQLTAAQVLQKASQKTSQVDTFRADLTVDAGTSQGAMNMHATAQFRLKPSVAFSMNIDKARFGGQSLPTGAIQMVYLNKIIYMKMPQLAQVSGGKPWLKIDLAQVSKGSGLDIDSLLDQSQQANPAEQTKMFTASKDAHKVGEETIDGVKTTHYAGTIATEEALSKLDAKTRQELRKVYQGIGANNISFDLWADNQQLPRKLITKFATSEGTLSTTVLYHDYGKTVSVAAPPADQVGNFNGLKGLNG
jgi:hypothetical protein